MPFRRLEAVAAPLFMENVDTDQIFPGRFLKTTSREGLGEALFYSLRQSAQFVLNKAPWDQAGILIALENFGCGSSREHAPWALLDFGIRCIIAPSIADIFYSNCIRNGILPVTINRAEVTRLMLLASNSETSKMTVDLENQSIRSSDRCAIPFYLDAQLRNDLLSGVDEVSRTLEKERMIVEWESRNLKSKPWWRGISRAELNLGSN